MPSAIPQNPPTKSGTTDGYHWTKDGGLEAGIPCIGAIQPQLSFIANESEDTIFDVAVIGAGYTGLTATRDLAITGHKTLLIEARDRIGGRSWTSNIDGYPFEMGGTWVHWSQCYIWREMTRYNLIPQLEVSPATGYGFNKCSVKLPDGTSLLLSHEEETALFDSSIRKLINVDGAYGKKVVPRMLDTMFNREAAIKLDQTSLKDRFAEIELDLTPMEKIILEGFLSTCTGTQEWANASMLEMVRWWALGNYSVEGFMEADLTYKLKCGQSGLQRCLFDEANDSGNLSYSFDSPTASVIDHGDFVEVKTRNSKTFKARRLVCTIPLNVLHTIDFTPPLPAGKTAASLEGHCNHVVKAHAEVADPSLRTMTAYNYPSGKLTYAFADGTTPAGNTHLVAFGSALEGVHLQPEKVIDDTLSAWDGLHAGMDIRRMVFHNWHSDEFARGAWEFFRPGQVTKYLDVLREKQGNVHFGSADWAMGWRGFLDGGIEDGMRVAKDVSDELRAARLSIREKV